VEHRHRRLDRVGAAERPIPARHLVEHDAEREQIGSRVHGLAAHLLGRHITDRAQDRSLGCLRRGGRVDAVSFGGSQLGDPEVEDLHASVARAEQVLRLEVAVGDAFGVRGGERLGDLRPQLDHLARRKRSACEPLAQRLTLEQLADDVGDAAFGADVEDVEDPGVLQRAGGARLDLEALERVRIVSSRGRKHLERDVTPEPRIPGAVDLAHPTGADGTNDLVRSQAVGSPQRHCPILQRHRL
jgi:hypothetical protein